MPNPKDRNRALFNEEIEIHVNGEYASQCNVLSLSQGSLTIKLPDDASIENLKDNQRDVEIAFVSDGKRQLARGKWDLSEYERQNQQIKLTPVGLRDIGKLPKFVYLETLLNENSYRVLLPNNHDHQKEIQDLMTEVKDFGEKVICDCFCEKQGDFKARLSFDSNKKDWSRIEIEFDDFIPELKKDERVDLCFEFLGSTYALVSDVTEVDYDFGVVEVSPTGPFITFNGRKFLRCPKEVKSCLIVNDDVIEGVIKWHNVKGGVFFAEQSLELSTYSGCRLSIEGAEFDVEIRISLEEKGQFSYVFIENEHYKDSIFRYLEKCLPLAAQVRRPTNYNEYLKLASEYGYNLYGLGSEELAKKYYDSWEFIDKNYPLNTLMFMDNGMEAGVTSIPLAEEFLFANSGFMKKDIHSAKHFYWFMSQTNNLIHLDENIKYFGMTCQSYSGFVNRMYTSHRACPTPYELETQKFLQVDFKKNKCSDQVKKHYQVKESQKTPSSLMMKILSRPHHKQSERTRISFYDIFDDSRHVATYMVTNGISGMTFRDHINWRNLEILVEMQPNEIKDLVDQLQNFGQGPGLRIFCSQNESWFNELVGEFPMGRFIVSDRESVRNFTNSLCWAFYQVVKKYYKTNYDEMLEIF